jgi:NAD(P)H-hydrate epimerase
MALEIISSATMKKIEKKAFAQGASDKEWMQTVGDLIANYFLQLEPVQKVIVVVGKGNNGGDGVVVAKNLHQSTIDVTVFHLYPIDECSPLLQHHLQEFKQMNGKVIQIHSAKEIVIEPDAVILDALLGTGFSGEVEGLLKEVIEYCNQSHLPIFAIDIPSGLNGDNGKASIAIKADLTFFLARPKSGFFLERGFEFVGKLVQIDFGLSEKEFQRGVLGYQLTTQDLQGMLPHPKRTQHKYEAGLVCALATHFEMLGASILASLAALKIGAGYLRFLYTTPVEPHLSAVPVECVKSHFLSEDLPANYEKAKAYFLGPGLPTDPKTKQLVIKIIESIDLPAVIDGGALLAISEHKELLKKRRLVLTPHRGEMAHFLKLNPLLTEEDLKKCQQFVNEYQTTLVLKGAPTFIFHPDKPLVVSAFGDVGMATAGAGDVLTGMIAGLLAQGQASHIAAQLGVGLHGIAGQIAAQDLTSQCIIASDLITYLPEAVYSLS